MTNQIQIAPLKKDFQRLIDFDRLYTSSKIVVFVSKSDTRKGTPNYKGIEESLKKLREYCELAKIQFNMQVIDIETNDSFLEVILDFARALLVDFQTDHRYLLNLGNESFSMSIALLQAAQLVQNLNEMDYEYFITEEINGMEKVFQKKIYRSFGSLISEPVSLELLNCIDEGMNLEAMKNILKISLGSISNHLKHLKNIGLLEAKGHERNLTDLGMLVKKVLVLSKGKNSNLH